MTATTVQVSLEISGKKNRDRPRKEKVIQYHDNGEVQVKGKEKRYYEHLGCLGLWPVYKRHGRWKFYNDKGELIKVIVYKKDKEIRVIDKDH